MENLLQFGDQKSLGVASE